MGFRFLHTADWQIGKRFGRFDSETSLRLQEERLQVLDRIADAAREAGAGHIVVAGDVFDQQQPSNRILHRTIDRLAQAKDLTWWLLPGNHDPAGPLSLWERLAKLGLPSNVELLVEARPYDVVPGVAFLPAPWFNKRPGRDLTEAFSAMQTEAAIRIGVAHGSVKAFGSDPDQREVIPADRADQSSLTYLALGDWHGTQRAGPRAWYAGTPEPDSFTNNARGQVLLVNTDAPDTPTPIATKTYDWIAETLVLKPEQSPTEQVQALFPEGESLDRRLLELTVEGHLNLSAQADWDAMIEAARARMAYLDLRDEALQMIADPGNLQDTLDDGILRAVAESLSIKHENGDNEASEALMLLAKWAQR